MRYYFYCVYHVAKETHTIGTLFSLNFLTTKLLQVGSQGIEASWAGGRDGREVCACHSVQE